MFKTIRETKKALLLEEDGRTFWIQKRWLREDGTLTPSGEAARNAATTKEEWAAAKQAKRNEMIPLAAPDWENERAIGIDVVVVCVHTEQARRARIFFPKSQIVDGAAPRWLVDAKITETLDKVSGSYPVSALIVEGLTR